MKWIALLVLTLVVCGNALVVDPSVDYVVVGAGAAGIAAGRALKDAGKSFIVLEALDRFGGRVFTNYDVPEGFDYPFEEGAWWLQESNVNPLVNYTEDAGIPIQLFVQGDVWVYENGVKLKKHEVNAFVARWSGHWDAATPFFLLGRSSAEALQLGGYTTIDNQVELAFAFLDEQIYADNLEYHDSTGSEGIDNPGDDYLVTNGYDQVLQHLIQNPVDFSSQIIYQRKVVKIDATNAQVDVTYRVRGATDYDDNDESKRHRVTANKGVIVTASLGALRSGIISFVPTLPTPQQHAIDTLLFGLANKVALYFDRAGKQILKKYKTNYLMRVPHGPQPRINDGIMVFFNDQYVRGQPALYSFYQGDYARYLETLTDAQIVDKHMTALREIIPEMPDPIDTIITRWGQQKFFKGVYTDFALYSQVSDFNALTVPVGIANNVYFAGEHVGWPDQGYVHRAYKTGTQAAQALINLE